MACFKFTVHLTGWVSQVILIMSNSILFLSSLIGNSLVIYLVWSKATLKTPTYLLISFLAMSDLLTSLFGQVSYCISLTLLKDVSCVVDKALAFVHVTSYLSSLLLLSLIARDRYLHVSKQHNYLGHTNNRFAITASLVCFLFGMMVASLFIFDDRCIQISRSFAFAVIGNSSFIFICLKSKQVVRIVQQHSRQMQVTTQNTSASKRNASTDRKELDKSVNRSIFSFIMLFFVSWTPVTILMVIFTVKTIQNEPIVEGYRVALAWGATVSYFNGALNPTIYAYRCDAIGREVRKVLRKVPRRSMSGIAPSTIHVAVIRKPFDAQKIEKSNKADVDNDEREPGNSLKVIY